jgi:C4-dicarboxylate transporter DctQ subunit
MVDKLEEYVCFVTLAIMSCAVLLQIINRSFLGRPFPYGEELARYMMVWATMFGTSAGLKIGAHVGVDALVQIIPPKSRFFVTFATSLAALAFFAFVGYLSIAIVLDIRETGQISPALQLPMWIAYLALPTGFILCFFRQYQLIVKKLREFRDIDANAGGVA